MTTDPGPLLRPAPAGAAAYSVWKTELIAAAKAALPSQVRLTVPWDHDQLVLDLELRAADGPHRLRYFLTSPVTVPAGDFYPAQTLRDGTSSVGGFGNYFPGVAAQVFWTVHQRVNAARDSDPSLAGTFLTLELHQMACLPLRSGQDEARRAAQLGQLQLALTPLLCARDAEHRAVLIALSPDWTGTIAELLDAAEAVLQP